MLSVDRALRKISLRRVRDGAAATIRRSRSLRPKRPATGTGATRTTILVASLVAVTLAAAVIAQRMVVRPPDTEAPKVPDAAPVQPSTAMRKPRPAPIRVRKSQESDAPATTAPTLADPEGPLPITITGCLEWDRQMFWLKNPSGAEVPKARSWKSGFFKKRSAPIALDAADTSNFRSYVGRRVAATGTLADGQLRTRSLQPVATSCN